MGNKKHAVENDIMRKILTSPQDEGCSMEWLDILVHFTLNPEKHFVETMSADDGVCIKKQLSDELIRTRRLIQQQMFSIHSKTKAEMLVRNYHSTLTTMLSKSVANLENLPEKSEVAGAIIIDILKFLEELVSMVESQYAIYMSMDEYVPTSYFRLAQKELSSRLKKIRSKIRPDNPNKTPLDIITNKLSRFLYTNEFEYTTSYKNIIYKKKLISEIENADLAPNQFQSYTALDEVLVYLNFNSVDYTNYLISFIKKRLDVYGTTNEKEKELYFLFKSFNQLHKRPDIAYNQNFHSIEVLLNNWFNQELAFFDKLLGADTDVSAPSSFMPLIEHGQRARQKITCMLSSDQIGLILRAASQQRILVAKSMSEVFKAIVPYLSTPAKEDLSCDGMRSKSYVAEERDKKIAIDVLEQVIAKIKEF